MNRVLAYLPLILVSCGGGLASPAPNDDAGQPPMDAGGRDATLTDVTGPPLPDVIEPDVVEPPHVCTLPDGGAPHWTHFASPFPATNTFRSVWGASSCDVWAAGDGGIAHWDGVSWSVSPSALPAVSVWASSKSDAWAVSGFSPANTQHWDGVTWSVVAKGFDSSKDLNGVWGTDATHVFLAMGAFVGSDLTCRGGLASWGGSSWANNLVGYGAVFNGIWGTGIDDFWAMGDWCEPPNVNPGVAHWNGTALTHMVISAKGRTSGIGGSSANDVWAIVHTDVASIMHWNGAAWTTSWVSTSTSTASPYAVWASGPKDAWAVGTGILYWEGAAWTQVSNEGGGAIWGASANDLWVVGSGATILHYAP